MSDLSLKLKTKVIYMLTRNPQNLDVPYLVKKEKSYTRRELSTEIEVESDFGIELLSSMIMLAIDISSKNKI